MGLTDRMKRLERSTGTPPDGEEKLRQAQLEKRRAEIGAELETFETRRRGMSEAERKADLERLEAELERRRLSRGA